MLQHTKRQAKLFEMHCFTMFIIALCVIFEKHRWDLISDEKAFKILIRLLVQVPSGAYSTDAWVGSCGLGVETLTLFY